MIKVACFTNLDIQCGWPSELAYRPFVGEKIRSLSGNYELKIVAITHMGNYLQLELNK